MKKLLWFLVILGLLAYAAFKGSVWWLATQRLDDMQERYASEAVVRPGSVGSGLAGTLTLNQARFEPFRMTRALELSRVQFDTGSPVSLLEALWRPTGLPPAWRLEVDGARLPLDPAMLRNWVVSGDQRVPSLFMPVCGPDIRQQMGAGDLMRMGVNELAGEALLVQGAAGLSGEISTAIGSIEMDWPGARLSGLPRDSGAQSDGSTSGWLRQLAQTTEQPVTLVFRDAGLMRKIAAYCSREAGVDTEQWSQMVSRSFREGLNARGFEPSAQLLALYRRWVTEGGKLELSLAPGEPVWGVSLGVEQVQDVEQDALVDQDALRVRYNDARVPDVFLMPVAPEFPETPVEALEPMIPRGPGASLADWHEVPAAEAERWLERRVRMTLDSGRVVEGRLSRVGETRLEVLQRVDRGEVAYPAQRDAIDTLEVWHRGSPSG